jgi:hypothetical protein
MNVIFLFGLKMPMDQGTRLLVPTWVKEGNFRKPFVMENFKWAVV